MNRTIIHIICFLLMSITSLAAEYQKSISGTTFQWGNSDIIGIYTTSGTRMRYSVSSNQQDNHYANFYSGYGQTENTLYYAYSPYNSDYWNKSITSLPISYTSQTQSANSNTNHLASYDYQMAKFTTTSSSSSVSFKHIGAILNFSWTLPKSATLKSLTLSSDEDVFTTDATMNLQAQTVSSVTKSKSITLALDNIYIRANGTLDAYLAILPVNLTNKTITATLTTYSGETITTSLIGTNIQAGKTYPVTIGDNKNNAKQSSNAKSTTPEFATTQITYLTAYSPDFLIDTDNVIKTSQPGDVNHDGDVNITDITILIKHCKDGTTASLDKETCDINGDGKISIEDAEAIADNILNNLK